MKANYATIPVFFATLLFLTASTCFSQNQTTATTGDYVCVQRQPHSRIWQRAIVRTNSDATFSTNFQSYTELASGLCYVDPISGQYVDSIEQIDLTATGAQAIHGAHQVQWAANANIAGGALQLTTPDGKIFNSRVFGLAYWDSAAGTNVLIGQLQDSIGAVVGSNQVLYSDIFSGSKADLIYVYTKAGVEQNVVLREQLPSPSNYGLNPESTTLQIMTEFLSPPAPVSIYSVQSNASADDSIISFGTMYMGIGRAFLTAVGNDSTDAGLVAKHWTVLDGRTFLIEEVPFSAISSVETNLPLHASLSQPSSRISRAAALRTPPPKTPKTTSAPMKVAKSLTKEPGFLIDYAMVSSGTNLIFKSDTTYYVSGNISIYGTNNFEGDTVIKYAPNAAISTVPIPATLQLNYLTGPYRPVVFTAQDDDSAGVQITGSTGNPWTNYYANPALSLISWSGTIDWLRISFARQAISISGGSPTILDAQFVSCSNGISGGGMNVTVENALFASVIADFNGLAAGNSVLAENVTFGSNQCLLAFADTNYIDTAFSASFTNCVFSQVTNLAGYPGFSAFSGFTPSGDHNGFYLCTNFGSSAYPNPSFPFQSCGAASYYLSTYPFFIDGGAPDTDPNLVSHLQNLTVFPPTVISGWITASTNLSPTAARNSPSVLSLGFHYPPIDFALNVAISNATVTVAPYTVLAMYGSQYGVGLYSNGVLNCEGTATEPNYIVRYNTVQEQSTTNWETTGWMESIAGPDQSDASSASFAYTKWSTLADGSFHIQSHNGPCPLQFQGCEFYGGGISDLNCSISSSNTLYQRNELIVKDSGSGVVDSFYNSQFLNGSLTIRHGGSSQWTFRDNLFDSVLISNLNGANIEICSNNAYVTNFSTLTPENNDRILSASPEYETGLLGGYYLPTNSPLITNGSQLANVAGLALFTVTTNNVPDGTNFVSIGYHYFDVAMPPEVATGIPPGTVWVVPGQSLLVATVTNAVPAYPVTYGWQTNGGATPYYGTGYATFIDVLQYQNFQGVYTLNFTNAFGTTSFTWNVKEVYPGTIQTWGDDVYGECDAPNMVTNCLGIAAGEYQSVAVTDSNTIYQWGEYSDGTSFYSVTNTSVASQPPTSGIIAVAAGLGQGLALTTNNTVIAWGLNGADGTTVPSQLNLTNVKAIACGSQFDLALRNDGTVTAWGINDATLTNVPAGLSNVTAIAAGPRHSLAISNGYVVAWGYNSNGDTVVPAGLSNVVAVAAGMSHSLALKADGTVVGWGLDAQHQIDIPTIINSNAFAISAGDNHSVALLDDGTIVAWGDNSGGQTTVPSVPRPTTINGIPGVPENVHMGFAPKYIAAGGDHTLISIFSPLVQYPIDVSNDVLLIYNSNSLDSFNVCQYYLTHRPMVSNSNVLPIGCVSNDETFYPYEYTNDIVVPVQNWLAANPTKRPQYVILFQDIPSRVDYYGPDSEGAEGTNVFPSVQYQLHSWCSPAWFPFVTAINMNGTGGTNDCIGYINKLQSIGSLLPGRLILSGGAAGFGNTNYYFDDSRVASYAGEPSPGSNAVLGIMAITSAGSISYTNVMNDTSIANHLTNGLNLAGYLCWGTHSSLGTNYATNGAVNWTGNSGWWIIRTVESYNGDRIAIDFGNFLSWFAASAFGGLNYTNTPVASISYTDEPEEFGTDDGSYFGLWQSGKNFSICVWNSNNNLYPQAAGDPFVTK